MATLPSPFGWLGGRGEDGEAGNETETDTDARSVRRTDRGHIHVDEHEVEPREALALVDDILEEVREGRRR